MFINLWMNLTLICQLDLGLIIRLGRSVKLIYTVEDAGQNTESFQFIMEVTAHVQLVLISSVDDQLLPKDLLVMISFSQLLGEEFYPIS